MDEKMLFWIALVCSLIGLAGVVLASQLIQAKQVNIIDIDDSMEGEYVKVIGDVINLRETEKAVFLDVKDDTGTIAIVAFNDNTGFVSTEVLPPNLNKGDAISIEGKVSMYQDKPEIMAEKAAISF
jgi:DNA/RNA endonuclease YhcR with UshA esterase domain